MKRKIRLSVPLQFDSIVDGEGLRCVIWTQGCKHHCPDCHNPQTHDFNGGYLEDIEVLKVQMKERFYLDGITFSGGDPMEQAEACLPLAKYAHEIGFDVWCYTGYTYEALVEKNDGFIQAFLDEIDILVDGPFIKEKKTLECLFRGSGNQRLIDMKKTKENNRTTLKED